MKSYIAIHSFVPKKYYPNLNEIEIEIKKAITIHSRKNPILPHTENKIKKLVLDRMKEYNELVGISDKGLYNPSLNPPNGILPNFTYSIIKYFANLDEKSNSKEIKILELSGIKEIKIRYKHSFSVIKKLVKIAFEDINYIINPYEVFLRNGRLHDLIGIDFVCYYPYQRTWVARALYNFFKIPDRTDFNLIFGFYKLNRTSGYKALHCDKSYFKPSFDFNFLKEHYETRFNFNYEKNNNINEIINYIKNKQWKNEKNQFYTLLPKMTKVFNIEIQIHTAFESIWGKMEHEKSYDILAKGQRKKRELEVLWKVLSDNLTSIENQFEYIQYLTDNSIIYDIEEKKDFNFAYELIKHDSFKNKFNESVKLTEKLKHKLFTNEISRREYTIKIEEHIKNLTQIEESGLNKIVKGVFLLQKAFIYYSYTNLNNYYNIEEISELLKKAIYIYDESIINSSINDKNIIQDDYILIVINAIIRYIRISQKNGFGLISTKYTENNSFKYTISQHTNKQKAIKYCQYGLDYMINLKNKNIQAFHILKKDKKSYLRTILYFYKMIMEIELDIESDEYSLQVNTKNYGGNIKNLIVEFKKEFITENLKSDLMSIINNKETTDTSFMIGALSMFIRNNIIKPIDALKIIINLSLSNKLRYKDLFYYEEASYKYLYENYFFNKKDIVNDDVYKPNKHYGDYHFENMIYLLFKMKDENIYEYYKAQIFFNKLVDNDPLKEKLRSLSSKQKEHFSETFLIKKYVI